MLVQAVQAMCASLSSNERLQSLLGRVELHIAPNLNPDGHEKNTKGAPQGFRSPTALQRWEALELERVRGCEPARCMGLDGLNGSIHGHA